jgi:membrane protease YdiL (CAAX protease family)
MVIDARPARRGLLAATAYAALYLACLAALWRYEGRHPAEAIAVLVIMGGIFPSLAWLTTRGAIPHRVPVRFPARELRVVLVLLAVVAAFLTVGTTPVRSLLDDPTAAGLADLAIRLLVFVGLPALVVRAAFGYGWRELFADPAGSWRGHWRALVVLSLSLVAMQLVLGRGALRIREAGMTPAQIAVAAPLALLYLCLEVGLVEEFFFRALLQQRIAAATGSAAAAVFVASALFGLAHAPGLYLRGAGSYEGFAGPPSLLLAAAYSVVVMSVAGLFLGTLWARTRNLPLVVVVHAATDLVPQLVDVSRTLRLL